MPKRTNRFQQLIYMIQRQLAGTNAVVTESRFLTNRHTGIPAEIDVVIEGKIAGHNVTLGIECTAGSRPATIEWVNEMIGKHRGMPIDRSILVSESGFTRNAKKNADANGVLAITLTEAQDADWKQVVGSLDTLVLGSWEFIPKNGSVDTDGVLSNEELIESRVLEEGWASDMSFPDYVKAILGSSRVFEEVVDHYLQAPPGQRKPEFDFTINNFIPGKRTIVTTKIGKSVIINKMTISAHTIIKETPMRLLPQKFQDTPVAHGTAANIFTNSSAPVLVTVIKTEEKTTASLRIPDFEGTKAIVFDMTVRAPAEK